MKAHRTVPSRTHLSQGGGTGQTIAGKRENRFVPLSHALGTKQVGHFASRRSGTGAEATQEGRESETVQGVPLSPALGMGRVGQQSFTHDGTSGTLGTSGTREQTWPKTLVPFDRREGCQIEEAARIAGKSVRTMRLWAEQHHIARRVGGGHWIFSRVALQMFLDGNDLALDAYLKGDRSSPIVVAYYERDGLGDIISRWRNFSSAKAAIKT